MKRKLLENDAQVTNHLKSVVYLSTNTEANKETGLRLNGLPHNRNWLIPHEKKRRFFKIESFVNDDSYCPLEKML